MGRYRVDVACDDVVMTRDVCVKHIYWREYWGWIWGWGVI